MSPIFTFILSSNIPLSFPITSMLISRHIMPSEVSDGQEDEHCCVDAGREQKGHKVQFHLRVISPHPDTRQGVREDISKALGGGH